jgi:hypothetical protein
MYKVAHQTENFTRVQKLMKDSLKLSLFQLAISLLCYVISSPCSGFVMNTTPLNTIEKNYVIDSIKPCGLSAIWGVSAIFT